MNRSKQQPFLLLTLFFFVGLWITTFAVAKEPPTNTVSLPKSDLTNNLAYLATQTNPCSELQVVFLVDQSGSMFGFTDDNGQIVPPTDPLGLRFAAPENAFARFGAFRYQRYQNSTIQFAVVYFGDQPKTQIPWTDITPNSQVEFDQLQQDISPLFPLNNSLGETVVKSAFETASSLFIQVPPQQNGCPTRAVIVVTDGQPYSSAVPGFNWQGHLQEVAGYVHQYMPSPDYQIYVIGVDEDNSYWPTTESYWEDITSNPDQVFQAQSQAEMSSLVLRITSELMRTLGEGLVSGCADETGILYVPGAMQKIYITLSKWDANVHLVVEDPLGRLLDVNYSGADVEFDGFGEPVETLIVENPQPGAWRVLTVIPDNLKDVCAVSFDALTAVKQPIAPLDGDQLIQFRKSPIEFQLVTSDGDPLPNYNDPNYDLEMDVKIWSNGIEEIVTSGVNPGQAYVNNDFIPLQPGPISLRVTATTRDQQGNPYPILADETIASFMVLPVTFKLLEGPAPDASLEQYVEFPLSFGLVVTDTQPIAIDLPLHVSATITHIDSGEQFTLSLPPDANNTYQTTFTPNKPGRYQLAYTAYVDTPETQLITEEELFWDVFPVTLVHVEFVSPEKVVATDPFLRPTGLDMQIQLKGQDGQPITPSAMGIGDPNALFTLKLLDGDNNELSGYTLIQTGTPGGYRLSSNELGPDNYTIVIEPIATPAKGYAWEQTNWTKELEGTRNPQFYLYLAFGILIVLAVVLFIIGQIQIRQHPLSGRIEIWASIIDSEGNPVNHPIDAFPLPNRNRVDFHPKIGHEAGKNIKRIRVISSSKRNAESKIANVEIWHRGSKDKWRGTLIPNNPLSPGGTYRIVKDPSASRNLDDPNLSGEFTQE